MAVVQEYKCPCCDGAIAFDSRLQKMKCPYCDTEFEPETLRSYDEELKSRPADDMHWDTAAGGNWDEQEAAGLRVYRCNSCGGEIVGDETTAATSCPYCDNPVVLMGQFAGDLKPDFVIPFKLDKQAAVDALKKHYRGKKLLPKVFQDENHIQEIKGVYVPFWLYDTDADAHVRYKTSRTRVWMSGDYRITETSFFSVVRSGSLGFERVPVDGSAKMEDSLMESIEPYHFADAVDFQTAYLAGFFADKYDVDAEQSATRANERIRRTTEAAFASTVTGYDTVTPLTSDIRLRGGSAKYALFPVWLLNTDWNGKKYTFAMNGQTGKLVGDLPMDKGAFWRWLLGVAGIATAAVFGLSYLLWLL